eukprot:Em0008g818a
MDPRQLTMDPRQQAMDPRQQAMDSRQQSMDPRQPGLDPRQQAMDPRQPPRGPQSQREYPLERKGPPMHPEGGSGFGRVPIHLDDGIPPPRLPMRGAEEGFRCTRRKRYPLTLNLNLTLLAPFRDRSKVRTTCFSVLGPLNPLDVSKVVVLKIITLWMVTLTTKDPLEVHAIRQMARAPPGVNATCLPKVKDPLEALVIPLLKTKDPREVNATLLLDFSQGGVKDVGRVLPEVLRPPMGVLRMNLLHLKIPEWVEVVPRSIQEDLTRSMITKGVMGRRKTLSSNTTGRACSQVDLSPEGDLYCRPLCRGSQQLREEGGGGERRDSRSRDRERGGRDGERGSVERDRGHHSPSPRDRRRASSDRDNPPEAPAEE